MLRETKGTWRLSGAAGVVVKMEEKVTGHRVMNRQGRMKVVK